MDRKIGFALGTIAALVFLTYAKITEIPFNHAIGIVFIAFGLFPPFPLDKNFPWFVVSLIFGGVLMGTA